MNYQTNLGNIKCRVCGVAFQSEIHRQSKTHAPTSHERLQLCRPDTLLFSLAHPPAPFHSDLSDPIDVYSEWIDQTEKVNKDVAKGHTNEDEYEDEDELGARGRDDED